MLGYQGLGPRSLSRLRLIEELIDDLTPGIALDVGCGRGFVTLTLLSRGWMVDAIDASTAAIDSAQTIIPEAYSSRIRLSVYDLEGIDETRWASPFREDGYDLIVCSEILEHLKDDEEVLSSLAGIIRPGGIAIITVPLDPNLMDREDEVVGHFRRYEIENILMMIRSAGLTLTHTVCWGFPLTRLVKRLLGPAFASSATLSSTARTERTGLLSRIAEFGSRLIVEIDSNFYDHDKSIGVVISARKPG